MANSIAFAKNYTGIIDEVYKRVSFSGCLTSGAHSLEATAASWESTEPFGTRYHC